MEGTKDSQEPPEKGRSATTEQPQSTTDSTYPSKASLLAPPSICVYTNGIRKDGATSHKHARENQVGHRLFMFPWAMQLVIGSGRPHWL